MDRIVRWAIVLLATVLTAGCSESGSFDLRRLNEQQTADNNKDALDYTGGLPWKAGQFQYGVNIFWNTVGSDEDIQRAARRALSYAISIGANSVAISFPLYTEGAFTSRVTTGPQTPSPDQLAIVIEMANRMGLRTIVRPLIDEASLKADGQSREKIQPADRRSWFASYRGILVTYAERLQEAALDEFVVGTQLVSLQTSKDEWVTVVNAVTDVFTKQISYSMNWNAIAADMPVRHFGVEAYPPLPLQDDATLDQVTFAVTGWLETLPENVRSKLTIQGTGIGAVSGAYATPGLSGAEATQNFDVQAKWIEAMILSAKDTGLQGVYFVTLDSNTDPLTADPINDSAFSFTKRPGEDVIRRYYMQ